MPKIVAAAARFPERYVAQADVAREFLRAAGGRGDATPDRVTRLFTNVGVSGRHMVLPLEAYPRLGGFAERSVIWLEHALELGSGAVADALAQAGLAPAEVALFASNTVTGIAVPSLEARLMPRLGFRPSCRRVPLFGLGCAAGAAGIARVSEYLRARPRDAAILLCVELCSLTFQLSDMSTANVIASALFGDAAACVVLAGDDHPRAATRSGPRVVDSASVLFPNTERTMGWDIVDSGFRVVLSGSVPALARGPFAEETRAFLAEHGLRPSDIRTWIAHPGGPAVVDALEQGLELPAGTLDASRRALAKVGNLSSASVITLLADRFAADEGFANGPGLLFAMGPGFAAELVLLEC
jgi:alkylresorcinol/alkylpyrone synthase